MNVWRIAAIAAAAALFATGVLIEPASASDDDVTLSQPSDPVPKPAPIPRPTERPIPQPPGGDPPPER